MRGSDQNVPVNLHNAHNTIVLFTYAGCVFV
jgi:hypothetical protein